jgi:hypothetical protein
VVAVRRLCRSRQGAEKVSARAPRGKVNSSGSRWVVWSVGGWTRRRSREKWSSSAGSAWVWKAIRFRHRLREKSARASGPNPRPSVNWPFGAALLPRLISIRPLQGWEFRDFVLFCIILNFRRLWRLWHCALSLCAHQRTERRAQSHNLTQIIFCSARLLRVFPTRLSWPC